MRQQSNDRFAVVMLIGLVLVATSGCGTKNTSEPETGGDRGDAALAQRDWDVPTDEECLAFGQEIEQLAETGDVPGFSDKIDWDILLHRSIGDFEDVDAAREGFITGFKQAVGRDGGLGGEIVKHAAAGGSYRLLRVHSERGQKRVLFRLLLSQDLGVNYHDWVLIKQPDGTVRGVDMYIFLSAELLSKSLRRAFVPIAAEASKSFLEKLGRSENDFVKSSEQLRQMAEAIQSGQPERALQIYRELPASVRTDKNVLLNRLRAAAELNDREYKAAIEDFRKHHPKDRCVDMLSIDAHIQNEDYDQVLACIDRLDQSLGGDPYLDVLRANSNVAQGDYEAARKLAGKALEADATLLQAYWTLVDISLREQLYDRTAELLTEIGAKFEVEFSDLTQVPDYAGFVQSPEYERWIETRQRALTTQRPNCER